jgi:hypothetical protein
MPARGASYLAICARHPGPALRVRMIALARSVGWLTHAGERAEVAAAIADVLASGSASFGEVDMVCALNGDRSLDAEIRPLRRRAPARRRARTRPPSPAWAVPIPMHARCGRWRAQRRGSAVAQAYLRHRPIAEPTELRAVVAGIVAMKAPAAQARALEALARLHVTDEASLDELARLFARHDIARGAARHRRGVSSVQAGTARRSWRRSFRERRVRSGGGEDLIDVLIRRMRS